MFKNSINKIKENLLNNKQLVLAGVGFTVSIFIIVAIFMYLKHAQKNNTASDGEITMSSNDIVSSKSSETFNSDLNSTSDTSENASLSDMDFTIPEDATEETETTLPSNKYPYMIKVNRLLNCVTIYAKDSKGNFTVPYKSMACSTGKYIGNTPLGTFNTSSKYLWRLMVDGTHSQYAYRIYGGILFHSVPCYSPHKDQLEVEEFNKLGGPASLGCIRLTVADAKWIYDNCPYGTTVTIYDDASSPGPLGKPEIIKIPLDSPNAGWDPTDPDVNNPWNDCAPIITVSDISIPVGSIINPLQYVTATDTCGNNISSAVTFTGDYNNMQVGTYSLIFHVTDLLGRTCDKTINLNVVQQNNSKPSVDSSTGSTNPISSKPTDSPTTSSQVTTSTTGSTVDTDSENNKETTSPQ